MTTRRARHRQYICNNPIAAREANGINCCEHCVDPPCVYVAKFAPCYLFTTITDDFPDQEIIKPTGYLFLLKECFRGCKWQSKWQRDDGCVGGFDYHNPACWFPVPMPADDTYPSAGGCCWWGGGTAFYPACDPDPDIQADYELVWELEITAPTTATLTVTPATGGTAVYDCTDWDCDDGGWFHLTSYSENLNKLPRCVEIVPKNTLNEPPLKCTDEESQCGCCDPGIDSGPIDVEITGCEGLNEITSITISRVYDTDGICGVTYPDPAPGCGVFTGMLSSGEGCSSAGVNWNGDVFLMIWCDGEDSYTMNAYCWSDDTDCYVQQGATITAYECRCNGFWIQFTLELDCCCPEVTECCPCSDADGRIVEVTFTPASGHPPLTCSAEHSGGNGECLFSFDGCNDGTSEASAAPLITCTTGGLPTISGSTQLIADPMVFTDWDAPEMTVTINSCDPIDWTFTGSQGTVTVVEVP